MTRRPNRFLKNNKENFIVISCIKYNIFKSEPLWEGSIEHSIKLANVRAYAYIIMQHKYIFVHIS